MKFVRLLGWCVGIGVWLAFTTSAFSWSFSLLSAASDGSVFFGIIMLFAVIAFVLFSGWLVIKFGYRWVTTGAWKAWAPVLLVFVTLSGSGCAKMVGAGYVGVVVNRAGSDRGVESLPVSTGWVWYNPITRAVYDYPIFVQTAKWTHSPDEGSPTNEEISFNSKEQLQFNADISLSYQLRPEKVPAFYAKFRNDDVHAFTHGFLRNVARDIINEVAGHYSIEEILATKKDSLLQEVRRRLNVALDTIGVRIEQFGFIGAPRAPEAVMASINAKVQAIQDAQQAQNRVAQAHANAQILIETANGQATANERLNRSITPQLIEWRRLALLEIAIPKWNGSVPSVQMGSGGGGMLFNLPLAPQIAGH